MKKIACIVVTTILASCSVAGPTIRKSNRHEEKLVVIAQKVFNGYSNTRKPDIYNFDTLNFTPKEVKLLRKKIKFDKITVVLKPLEQPGMITTDSLVIFTRNGFLNYGAAIIVDMHKKPSGRIPLGVNAACRKIGERVYTTYTAPQLALY